MSTWLFSMHVYKLIDLCPGPALESEPQSSSTKLKAHYVFWIKIWAQKYISKILKIRHYFGQQISFNFYKYMF